MMRRSAGLNTNEARRQPLKKWQNVPALELTANDYITCRVNSVDLKNRLGDFETNCRDRLHVWLLRIVGALTAPTSMALPCRWRSRPQHQKPTYAVQQTGALFDHLVGGHLHDRRHRQPERLRSLEINHELELGWLFHGQVGRFGTLQQAIDIGGSPTELISYVPAIGHQATRLDVLAALKGGRQAGCPRKLCYLVCVFNERGGCKQHAAMDFLRAQTSERALVFLGRLGFDDQRLQA